MSTPGTVVYLHGFASSPYGSKATYIRERCAATGVNFHAPDLNAPTFEHLTITAAIEEAARAIAALPDGPVHLIGSSMGGLIALHLLAERTPPAVHRLMLLAPGLGLAQRWATLFGGLDDWRESGWLPVHHYGRGAEARLHYAFYEDAQQYDGFSVVPPVPVRIIHGRHDDTVPVAVSQRYAAAHHNITLRILEADHGLTAAVDVIWREAVAFFDLPPG